MDPRAQALARAYLLRTNNSDLLAMLGLAETPTTRTTRRGVAGARGRTRSAGSVAYSGPRVPSRRARPRVVLTGPTPDVEQLRPADAARLLGVSTRTLATWHQEGRLDAIRTDSGHRRYATAALVALATPPGG